MSNVALRSIRLSSCLQYLCLGRCFSNDSNRPAQRIIGKNRPEGKPNVKVTFILNNGTRRIESAGYEGDSLLDIVNDNELDIDGFGACEGTLACSTCHLIFKKEDYDRLDSKPSEDENDMLDMAYGLCETSRLGCQVHLNKNLDQLEVIVPEGVNDARCLILVDIESNDNCL